MTAANGEAVKTSGHPVVDVHSHVLPTSLVEAARHGRSMFGMDLDFSSERELTWKIAGNESSMDWNASFSTAAERVQAMDRDGIDVQLLSINPAMFGYENDAAQAARLCVVTNSGIAEIAAEAPGRLRGLAHLPMQAPEAAATEVVRAVDELGMVGASIGTNIGGRDFDDPELRPVFEAVEALDVMLFVHPSADRFPARGHAHFLQNLIGHPVETTVAMASMIFGGVLDRFPGLRVCFAHGGGYGCMAMGRFEHGWRVREQCRQMAQAPAEYRSQLYVDTLTHSHAALRTVVEELGEEQVVIGTDYPTPMSQDDPIGWLDQVEWLSPRQRDRILSENAATLLGPKAHELDATASR